MIYAKPLKKLVLALSTLLKPEDWPTFQKHGIYCSMCYTNGENNLYKGLNDPANHEKLIGEYLEVIPEMAKYNYKNLICFSGTRHGMDDETGMKNCAEALEKILPLAKKTWRYNGDGIAEQQDRSQRLSM